MEADLEEIICDIKLLFINRYPNQFEDENNVFSPEKILGFVCPDLDIQSLDEKYYLTCKYLERAYKTYAILESFKCQIRKDGEKPKTFSLCEAILASISFYKKGLIRISPADTLIYFEEIFRSSEKDILEKSRYGNFYFDWHNYNNRIDKCVKKPSENEIIEVIVKFLNYGNILFEKKNTQISFSF